MAGRSEWSVRTRSRPRPGAHQPFLTALGGGEEDIDCREEPSEQQKEHAHVGSYSVARRAGIRSH